MQTLGHVITLYRKKKKLTQQELTEALNARGISVTNRSVSTWEKGKADPSAKTVLALCQILEIPDLLEECLGVNPYKKEKPDPMDALNDQGKQKVLEYIQLLLASHLYDKPAAEVIPFEKRKIKLFREMASAGTGNFLDGDDYEWCEVGDEVPMDADFGVRLSGDSMEPRFINHQIVWVRQQDALLNGEIGIFYLNGSAYCKKLQDDAEGAFLVSLNEKYAPIRIGKEDSLKIFGKVLA